MRKFPHFRYDASEGAARIIVLAFVVLATGLCLADPRSPTPSPSTTASPPPGCLAISSATIVNSGSYYMVGDILDPLFGTLCGAADNYGFRLQVTSVASPGPSCTPGGCVTGVTMISGIGYSVAPSNPIRFGGSPTGTGFTANCTFQ